jgi:hypothetical protein
VVRTSYRAPSVFTLMLDGDDDVTGEDSCWEEMYSGTKPMRELIVTDFVKHGRKVAVA